MIRVAAVVEGYGDVVAMPILLAKIGQKVGEIINTLDPIRTGEWRTLRQFGKLERSLDLALSRNPDKILVVLDLDDGCPVNEREIFSARLDAWRGNRQIVADVTFLSREYETLFLHCPSALGQIDAAVLPADPNAIRGAKERIKTLIGRRYRETQDQKSFTINLDMEVLYRQSRPFRKLCRAVSGIDYDQLGPMFGMV